MATGSANAGRGRTRSPCRRAGRRTDTGAGIAVRIREQHSRTARRDADSCSARSTEPGHGGRADWRDRLDPDLAPTPSSRRPARPGRMSPGDQACRACRPSLAEAILALLSEGGNTTRPGRLVRGHPAALRDLDGGEQGTRHRAADVDLEERRSRKRCAQLRPRPSGRSAALGRRTFSVRGLARTGSTGASACRSAVKLPRPPGRENRTGSSCPRSLDQWASVPPARPGEGRCTRRR